MDKVTLLARIHDTHAPLAGAAAALDDEAMRAPAPGMPGWTRKDVLAHVEWWNDHSVRVVEALLAGRAPYERSGPLDVDGWNARTLAENRDRTPADVRRGEADAFRRLVAAVEAAGADELFTVGRFAWLGDDACLADLVEGDSTTHYPEHVPHLGG
jgi:Mycothiol maleylpyruvate isomerase N-terminal domain